MFLETDGSSSLVGSGLTLSAHTVHVPSLYALHPAVSDHEKCENHSLLWKSTVGRKGTQL